MLIYLEKKEELLNVLLQLQLLLLRMKSNSLSLKEVSPRHGGASITDAAHPAMRVLSLGVRGEGPRFWRVG